jgi:hypothetical protein
MPDPTASPGPIRALCRAYTIATNAPCLALRSGVGSVFWLHGARLPETVDLSMCVPLLVTADCSCLQGGTKFVKVLLCTHMHTLAVHTCTRLTFQTYMCSTLPGAMACAMAGRGPTDVVRLRQHRDS